MTPSRGVQGVTTSASRLHRLRQFAADAKSIVVRVLLSILILLGVAAQIFKPLGDLISAKGFIGGSFAAFIALILFDAITSEDVPREVDGVLPLSDVDELRDRIVDAFHAKDVRIYFQGFTMETLSGIIRQPLRDLAVLPSGVKSLTLRVIVPNLDAEMNFPCRLKVAPATTGGAVTYLTEDSPEFRQEMISYQNRYLRDLNDQLDEIRRAKPYIRIDFEIRKSPVPPVFKLFIINDDFSYFGYYGIEKHDFIGQSIIDPKAFGGTRLIGWSRRSRTDSTRQIARYHGDFFDNLWDILEEIQPPLAPASQAVGSANGQSAS